MRWCNPLRPNSQIPRLTVGEAPFSFLKKNPKTTQNLNCEFLFRLPKTSTMAGEEFSVQKLLEQLSQTRYACSRLTKLSGGTANFLYRGSLLQPLDSQDGATNEVISTVVIKHSEGFVPGHRDFLLDVTRCVMTLPCFPPSSRGQRVS